MTYCIAKNGARHTMYTDWKRPFARKQCCQLTDFFIKSNKSSNFFEWLLETRTWKYVSFLLFSTSSRCCSSVQSSHSSPSGQQEILPRPNCEWWWWWWIHPPHTFFTIRIWSICSNNISHNYITSYLHLCWRTLVARLVEVSSELALRATQCVIICRRCAESELFLLHGALSSFHKY